MRVAGASILRDTSSRLLSSAMAYEYARHPAVWGTRSCFGLTPRLCHPLFANTPTEFSHIRWQCLHRLVGAVHPAPVDSVAGGAEKLVHVPESAFIIPTTEEHRSSEQPAFALRAAIRPPDRS